MKQVLSITELIIFLRFSPKVKEIKSRKVAAAAVTLYVDVHAYDGVDVGAFPSSCKAAVLPAKIGLGKLKNANPTLSSAYPLDLKQDH